MWVQHAVFGSSTRILPRLTWLLTQLVVGEGNFVGTFLSMQGSDPMAAATRLHTLKRTPTAYNQV